VSKFRLAVCTGFAASALLLIPAGSASAHVHGISPLECTPAPWQTTAGAIEGVNQAADAAELPEAGAIPRVKSDLGAELTGGQEAPVPMCP
jgi:hypothetical protein